MKPIALMTILVFSTATLASAQEAQPSTPPPETAETPPAGYPETGQEPVDNAPTDCEQIEKGGPIAGIVVASVFWWVLPMSIPVWITQAKKLKRRKKQIFEQRLRGCP